MNKNKLDRINEIEQEIKVIDKFLECKAYGILGSREYVAPSVIVDEIVKVLINRKEELLSEQKELWGS
ncbi:hypothetical protein [Pseudolactococcus paracarnosus]|uniref:hypothetical protein n=1 Tax=Pseudolactococcus paracarnosus TaxID=2749962 RepID=UPI001FBABB6E|nr:hypothetical protein [Lactococcus paracarnosus]MCJ1999228.1 hypothetical protein [Lactococcus paracarnosus]